MNALDRARSKDRFRPKGSQGTSTKPELKPFSRFKSMTETSCYQHQQSGSERSHQGDWDDHTVLLHRLCGERFVSRRSSASGRRTVQNGFIPTAVGLILAIGWVMAQAAAANWLAAAIA